MFTALVLLLLTSPARAAACASLYCKLVHSAVPPTAATTANTTSRSTPVCRRLPAVRTRAMATACARARLSPQENVVG